VYIADLRALQFYTGYKPVGVHRQWLLMHITVIPIMHNNPLEMKSLYDEEFQ
jgi:hypothetical protein